MQSRREKTIWGIVGIVLYVSFAPVVYPVAAVVVGIVAPEEIGWGTAAFLPLQGILLMWGSLTL